MPAIVTPSPQGATSTPQDARCGALVRGAVMAYSDGRYMARGLVSPVVQVCEPPIASFEASERPSTRTVPRPMWRRDEYAPVAVAVGANAAVPLSEGRNHEMATRHRACGDHRDPTHVEALQRNAVSGLLARSGHLTPR